MRRVQRGSALLTAVVVVMVVTVIGVGIINFSSRELAGATASAQEQALVACAEDARKVLLAQFHVLGFDPSAIQPLNKAPLGTTTGTGTTFAVSGHYGETTNATMQVTQVTYMSSSPSGQTSGPVAVGRRVTGGGGVGSPVRVIVRCQDGSGKRELEMEFGIKYGL